jgi:flagellar biosynthesis protein FlhG
LLVDSPTSKGARNIERIARRLLAVAAARETERMPVPIPLAATEPTLYDILLTHRGASDEELRRAYRRQVDLYETDSLAATSLLTDEQLAQERARIDEAHATLLDPLKRRAYDVSTFTTPDDRQERQRGTDDHAAEHERAMLREELARELTAETRFSGPLLRKVRESQGVEIEDIALRTKISRAHLKAIEEDNYEELPAFVYLRGFLQEVSKFLKLDPTQVARSYLVRYRDWRRTRPDLS